MSSNLGIIRVIIEHADEDNTIVHIEDTVLLAQELIGIRDYLSNVRLSEVEPIRAIVGLHKLFVIADAMVKSIEEEDS